MESAPRILDARGLPPPQPLELVLEALDGLGRGEALVVLLEREPLLLYPALRRSGFVWHSERRADGTMAVRIGRAGE